MAFVKLLGFDSNETVPFPIGAVGYGIALEALSRLIQHLDFAAAFPTVRFAGWVPGESPVPSDVASLFSSCPRFDDVASLVAACPGIRGILDLSPDCRHIPAIRASAPVTTVIGTSDAVLRFCKAFLDGRLAMSANEKDGHAQKLFGLLVDQIDGDMLILNESGVILDVNHFAAESRGIHRKDMIGKPCSDFDPEDTLCFHTKECPFVVAKESGKAAEHIFDFTLSSGRVQYLHVACAPVTDAFGGPTHYMYIRRDVTEHYRLRKRLEMQEKDAELGKLTLYLAHEIRNPLFTIGGFANALYRGVSLDAAAREKARIIIDESRRLDVILGKILNFAKKAEQTMEDFALAEVISQSLELMGFEKGKFNGARGKVTVEVDLAPNLPLVRGNADNVRDSLNNMIKNSLEAMPEGGTLSLCAKRTGDYVMIEVRDTGRGIPPELREQVFNPFFSTSEGMGLGLAMSRKLVEEMGGTVLIDASYTAGTRICVLLPVALAVADGDDEAATGQRLDTASALNLISGSKNSL